MKRTSMAMLVLALCCGGVPLSAQSPTSGDAVERVKSELKRAIDRELARKVRALRAELHGAVDRAFERMGERSLDRVLAELEGEAEHGDPGSEAQEEPRPDPTAGPPSTGPVSQSAALRRLEAVTDRLAAQLGEEHPRVRNLREEIRWHPANERVPAAERLGLTLRQNARLSLPRALSRALSSSPRGAVLDGATGKPVEGGFDWLTRQGGILTAFPIDVRLGGLAARAGLRSSHTLMAVDGERLMDWNSTERERLLERAVSKLQRGQTVAFIAVRGHEFVRFELESPRSKEAGRDGPAKIDARSILEDLLRRDREGRALPLTPGKPANSEGGDR